MRAPARILLLVAIFIAIFITIGVMIGAQLAGSAAAGSAMSAMHAPSEIYLALAYVHLATIAPCFLIGTWLLLRRKGTPAHKALGKVYLALITISSVVAAAMPAAVGPTLWNHVGFIHVFCVFVFVSVPLALWSIKRGDVKTHAGTMRGLYFGGILIAGFFAMTPGRLLWGWLVG